MRAYSRVREPAEAGSVLGALDAVGVGVADGVGVGVGLGLAVTVGLGLGVALTVNEMVPLIGCPSALTTRYAARYVPAVSSGSFWVTVAPSAVGGGRVSAPAGPVSATWRKFGCTFSLKTSSITGGVETRAAPSAGVEETRAE